MKLHRNLFLLILTVICRDKNRFIKVDVIEEKSSTNDVFAENIELSES